MSQNVSSNTKDPQQKDMKHPIFLCYAARSHLHVPFSLYSHSLQLGTLHCSVINDICQNDLRYVTVFFKVLYEVSDTKRIKVLR